MHWPLPVIDRAGVKVGHGLRKGLAPVESSNDQERCRHLFETHRKCHGRDGYCW